MRTTNPQLSGPVVNKGRFLMWPWHGVMWDRKVRGYGTMKFANEMLRRRAKNKVAKKSRQRNRAR